jgi:isochorismate synthase
MEIKENTLSIYIGGGITASSNPKNEWEETVNKAQVMKSVL